MSKPGNELALLMLEALGENPADVVSMTMRFRADHHPTVIVERLVRPGMDSKDKIGKAFKRYELRRKE